MTKKNKVKDKRKVRSEMWMELRSQKSKIEQKLFNIDVEEMLEDEDIFIRGVGEILKKNFTEGLGSISSQSFFGKDTFEKLIDLHNTSKYQPHKKEVV